MFTKESHDDDEDEIDDEVDQTIDLVLSILRPDLVVDEAGIMFSKEQNEVALQALCEILFESKTLSFQDEDMPDHDVLIDGIRKLMEEYFMNKVYNEQKVLGANFNKVSKQVKSSQVVEDGVVYHTQPTQC